MSATRCDDQLHVTGPADRFAVCEASLTTLHRSCATAVDGVVAIADLEEYTDSPTRTHTHTYAARAGGGRHQQQQCTAAERVRVLKRLACPIKLALAGPARLLRPLSD
jgi:hypothetical protein